MAGTASASPLVFMVTASQILAGTGYSSSFSSNCGGTGGVGFGLCGIYGVGIKASNATLVTGGTAGYETWAVAPTTLAANDAWTNITLPSGGNGVEASDQTGGKIAFIANPTTGTNTAANALAADGTTAAYTPDTAPANIALAPAAANSTGVSSNAGILSAGTVFTFYVDFPTAVTTGTTANLNIEVVAMRFNASTGAQLAKTLDTTFLVSGVAGTAVPEPSSFLLLFGAAGAFVARRRMRSSRT